MAEYKLNYTAEEIDNRLEAAGGAVRYDVPQELTYEQRAQATKNGALIPYDWRALTCSAYPGTLWYSPTANTAGLIEYIATDELLAVSGGHLYNQSTGASLYDCTAIYQLVFYLQRLAENLHKDESWMTFIVEKIVEAYQLIDASGAAFTDSMETITFAISQDISTGHARYSGNVSKIPSNYGLAYTHTIDFTTSTNLYVSGTIAWNNNTKTITSNRLNHPYVDNTLSLKSYAAEVSAVNNALATKITIPETATVGQTIAVKTVNDSGKPTEWEAVDVQGGLNKGNQWELLCETISDGEGSNSGLYLNVDFSAYKEMHIEATDTADSSITFRTVVSKTTNWYDGQVLTNISAANVKMHSLHIWIIDGHLKIIGGTNSGYSNDGTAFFSNTPRNELLCSDFSYIRFDASNSVVPEGATLKVWGMK